MEITIQKTTKITNETIWFRVAPPKGGEAQWKDDFSAKELAKFVTRNSGLFGDLIEGVMRETGIKTTFPLIGEPEVETEIPGSNREGRNHDLLLYNENDDVVIGIEAKVDEPFGNNKSISQENNTNSKDKAARICWLMNTVLPGRNIEEEEVGTLKYQLFTATAGTLLEAVKKGKEKCVFLVLSFHRNDKPVKEVNKKSFDEFKRIVCGENNNSQEFTVEYEDNKTEFKKKVKCWFIEREITFTPEEFIIDKL